MFFVSGYYLAAPRPDVAALYFATILSFDVRFRNFFKGVLFFPYLINGVAIGFVFLYFFQAGHPDSVLSLFGRPHQTTPGSAPRRRRTSRSPVSRSGATWA